MIGAKTELLAVVRQAIESLLMEGMQPRRRSFTRPL